MAINVTRLTLFALLSAIETDLRRVIVDNIIDINEQAFAPEIRDKCTARLQKDQPGLRESTVRDFVEYLDFKEAIETILRNKDSLLPHIYQFLKSNEQNIGLLTPIRNRVAHSRPLESEDFSIVYDTSETLLVGIGGDIFATLQNVRRKIVEDPIYVTTLKLPAKDETTIFNNLPLPEFEDTGFIGRKDAISNVIKMILSPWPVISLIGDGGLGKTALALKVAYDILYHESCPFEAIIWTTSKTTQLTLNEIQDIDDSIKTSIGMFKNVSGIIGEDISESAVSNILEFMGLFRVLLIIDNLETIIDQKILDFLTNLPQGSKILITSRIGLGIEYKIKVDPLTSKEAVSLLRTYARIRGQQKVVSTHNSKLDEYCRQMNNNPAFIKWFVGAIVSGRRPEEILANSQVFLDYCMSNVYSYLTKEAKQILKSMMCIPRDLNQAELAYINKVDSTELQRSLQELTTTNMVSMISIPRGITFESKYQTTEFARKYLSMHHPVKNEEFKQFKHRSNQLIADSESINDITSGNQFSSKFIRARSKNDMLLIRHLLEAQNASKVKNFDKATALVAEARNLDPGYFEVKRVEATILMFQGLTSSANDAYLASIELDPSQPHCHYWYALFLVKFLSENEEAIKHLEIASKQAPSAFEVKFEMAKVLMYQKRYSESLKILEAILESEIPILQMTISYDVLIQNHYRQGEDAMDEDRFLDACAHYRDAFYAYQRCPEYAQDGAMVKVFEKSNFSLLQLQRRVNEVDNDQLREKVIELLELRERVLGFIPRRNREKLKGQIYHYVKENGWGFIAEEGSSFQVFFHVKSFLKASHSVRAKVGSSVSYVKIVNEKDKDQAVEIELI